VSARADWVVDLGHSRIKWGRALHGELLPGSTGAASVARISEFEQALAADPSGRVWLSGQSNVEIVSQVTTCIDSLGLSLQPVSTGTPSLPVQPAYAALGCDRWLALQWPWHQHQRAFCVVDCGTAVTVDIVDADGDHRGGWIMAGLDILRRGLLSRARGLPDVGNTSGDPSRPATSTVEAIAGGSLLQLTGAIEQAVAVAARTLGRRPTLWLTGGDATAVIDHLSASFQHEPDLVLRGLALATEDKS
jgi:type III pantothenate kinase